MPEQEKVDNNNAPADVVPEGENIFEEKATVETKVENSDQSSVIPPENSRIDVGLDADIFQVQPDILKNTIHIVAQSKGGTGKTQVASYLASFFQRHSENLDLYCFDLDSNTMSFAAFKAFNVQQFSEVVVQDGEINIDATQFDGAFNPILESINTDSTVVIDTGAGGSFWSLVNYIRDLDYPSLAAATERQWRFIIHVVISGSAREESKDALERLHEFIDNPYVEFVIWGNEFFGELKGFYDEIAIKYGEMFQRNVNLPGIKDARLRKSLEKMRLKNWSVTELFIDPECNAIDKARINQYFYGNLAGKPGVFRQLQYLDWII